MTIGKILVFVGGLTAGAGVMVGAGVLQNSATPQEAVIGVAESTDEVLSPESPFAVASEQAATLAESPDQTDLSASGDGEIQLLLQRIEFAESRIEELETALAEVQFQQNHPTDGSEFLPTGQQDVQQDAQQDSQTNLLAAGFEPATVEEIQNIRDNLQLERLDLRDRATREGWIGTDRFREEQRELRNASHVRDTLGDEDFDKFLLAEGRDNRVRIESVIETSAADLAGIAVGDIVMRYADERIFSFRDLQQSTTEGERDEPVNIQVSREGELIDLMILRGPMGVTLSGITGTAQ